MYGQSVGFGAGSVLGGLRSQSPYARGMAMQSAAGFGMARQQENQRLGLGQMQAESAQRQQQQRNTAQSSMNRTNEGVAAANLSAQNAAFNASLGSDYASMQKQRNLKMQQALLGGLASEF